MTPAFSPPASERLAGLADRCEAARGADRELDARIVEACGWTPVVTRFMREEYWERGSLRIYRSQLPQVTASLDAAMSLVPENADAAGERFRLEAYSSPGVLASHVRASAWVAGAPRVYAATPALALCAAALRARAHQETRP